MIARSWGGITLAAKAEGMTFLEPGLGEAATLAEELRAVVRGDAWHGPDLEGLLDEVSPLTAAARAMPTAHTIWELVLHLTGWTDVFRLRLEGVPVGEPARGDFPAVPPATCAAWAAAKADLFAVHNRLVARVARMSAADLGAPVAGRDYSARFLVRGAIRHTVYHTGQIALLRRLGASS